MFQQDFKKAFDLVDHELLPSKLMYPNLAHSVTRRVENYLQIHGLQVSCDGAVVVAASFLLISMLSWPPNFRPLIL